MLAFCSHYDEVGLDKVEKIDVVGVRLNNCELVDDELEMMELAIYDKWRLVKETKRDSPSSLCTEPFSPRSSCQDEMVNSAAASAPSLIAHSQVACT